MKRIVSTVALTAQTLWERFELPILLALAAIWLLVTIHIGAQRARP